MTLASPKALGGTFSAFGSSAAPTRGFVGLSIRLFVAELITHTKHVNAGCTKLCLEWAQEAVKIQKALVPVDTGDLKRSISHERLRSPHGSGEPDMYVAGPTIPLGAHGNLIEYGTYAQSPQPFVGPSADYCGEGLEQDIADFLGKSLGG